MDDRQQDGRRASPSPHTFLAYKVSKLEKKNKCCDRSMDVELAALSGNYDISTDLPSDTSDTQDGSFGKFHFQ